MELIEECARDKAGMGPQWNAYSFKCLPEHPQETELIEVTGAVAPAKSKSKQAGQPDWKNKDKSTIRTVYITLEFHAAWVREWEKKTGLCAKCKGTRQELQSISVTHGTTYRPCHKCKATGKPLLAQA